jgi:hypothetical protein
MRYQDQTGDEWADVIDFLTMYPEARRRVVRMLGEIQSVGVDDLERAVELVRQLAWGREN